MSRRRSARSKTAALQRSAVRRFAPIFAALGDETRLRLVAVLCAGGAVSIAQLTPGTDISRQAVTKHLHVLAEAGLLRGRKGGPPRPWGVGPAQLQGGRRSVEGARPPGGGAPGPAGKPAQTP